MVWWLGGDDFLIRHLQLASNGTKGWRDRWLRVTVALAKGRMLAALLAKADQWQDRRTRNDVIH
jgi:hypothetical protein